MINFKKLKIWLVLLIMIISSLPASGEYYRYVDNKGNLIYTDDLGKIPKNQMSNVKEYNEYKSYADNDIQQKESQPANQETDTENDTINRKLSFVAKRQELDKEYLSIMKEREQLEKERKSMAGKSKKEIKKKTEELNEKIENYQKKLKEFNEKFASFNTN